MATSSPDALAASRLALKMGQGLCLLAILFATGDVWPSIDIGFTLRLSQVLLLLAAAVAPTIILRSGVRLFPGWQWLGGFIAWIILTLPLSLYVERSVPYIMWAVTDALIILVLVQYFPSESSLRTLLRFFLVSFLAISLFGLLQLCLGLAGIDLLVAQWIVPGRFPRVNGLSYEPSYYSTYLLVGWVTSLYLLEKRASFPSRRLQKACALTSTLVLILCTSKLGWGLMLVYGLVRLLRSAGVAVLRSRIRLRTAGLLSTSMLFLGGLAAAVLPALQNFLAILAVASFLLAGLGIAGTAGHSVTERSDGFSATWNAWLNHPLIGTGVGALPVEVAAQAGRGFETVTEAKAFEGLNVFAEVLASTGLVGAALLAAFAIAVVRAVRRRAAQLPPWHRTLMTALSWGIVWMLLALQFSPTFLRIPIFIDVGVLVCCLTARPRELAPVPSPPVVEAPDEEPGVQLESLSG
jgi:hypothetical protein